MYRRKQTLDKVTRISEHRINITNAATWYVQIEWMTIDGLASAFHVSGNTINHWLCEAVAKGYISSIPMCKHLVFKHLMEYESKYNLKNSSLRQMYKEALALRDIDIGINL